MTESDPGDARRLRVALGDRSYDILVDVGLIDRAGEVLSPILRQPRVVIVSDETVAALYGDRLAASLRAAGIAEETIVVPPGEGSKDFSMLQRVVETLLDRKVERTTGVVALGGGVVGDLAGFAASIALRGLDFYQIPTTLLSQVDSAVGGKTGINTPHGKNLVGSFYQPRLVLADIGTLDSLPRREILAGYAEVVKYGFIRDRDFFEWLEANAPRLLEGDPDARRRAVLRCCEIKAEVVAEDEREAGRRALLNFGHTFGHAIEAESGYGAGLRHGEAVAIGMALAFELSARLGHCPRAEAARARAHLAAAGLPTGLDGINGARSWRADELIDHMRQDKKVRDGRIAFVLARSIGEAFLTDEVSIDTVRALLERAIAA